MNSAGMKSSTEGRQGWDEFGRDGNRPRREGKTGMDSTGMESSTEAKAKMWMASIGMDSTGMGFDRDEIVRGGTPAWRAGREEGKKAS